MKRLLAGLGAVSLLGQVVLLRELAVASYGNELALVLGLGGWLLGTALGAAFAQRGREPSARGLAPALLAGALLLPLLTVLARALRTLAGGVPGAFLPLPVQLAAVVLLMLPAAVPAGWLFARAARLATARGGALATAWAVECVGGLAGGAAATLLSAAGVGNLAQALAGGAATAALAATLPSTVTSDGTGDRRPWLRRPWHAAAAGVAVALAALVVVAPRLDRATTAWDHPDLRLVRDTPYARVTVEQRAGQVAIFSDGTLTSTSESTAAEEFVQLAALQAAAPRRVLVLGGAAAGVLAEARRLGADRLVHVEADRGLLAVLRALPGGCGLGAAGAGRAPEVVAADPRAWLARAADFDLILVGGPEPVSARDNRWYTREFFAACARALAPGGVLACRLPDSPNVWTPARLRQLGGIRRALADVFPQVVVMPATSTVFLASAAALPVTAEAPAARLRQRGADNRLVTPAYLAYLYTNDRFADLRARLAANDAPADTDARPGCYRQTLVLWLSSFFPALGWRDAGAPLRAWPRAAAIAVAALLAAGLLTAVRRRGARRRLALAATGAAGVLLESALLLNHQLRVGALYGDLGLLLCLFMAGLAVGAALPRRPGRWPRRAALAALPLAGLVTALLVARGAPGSLPAAGAAMAGAAAAVGLAFAALTATGTTSGTTTGTTPGTMLGPPVASMLAADLLGGAVGCLLAGLVLVPLWGPLGAVVTATALGLLVCLA
jgi:spermidine synthase